jgi:hypothetical protein
MGQITDQARPAAPGGTDSVDRAAIGKVLGRMAGHFTDRRPNDLLTPVALGAGVAGEVFNARGRTHRGSGAALSAAVTAALPLADFTGTRAEYADLLREAARAYGWSEDDNKRAIPTVPGPRTEPETAPPVNPATPTVPGPRPSTGRAA